MFSPTLYMLLLLSVLSSPFHLSNAWPLAGWVIYHTSRDVMVPKTGLQSSYKLLITHARLSCGFIHVFAPSSGKLRWHTSSVLVLYYTHIVTPWELYSRSKEMAISADCSAAGLIRIPTYSIYISKSSTDWINDLHQVSTTRGYDIATTSL